MVKCAAANCRSGRKPTKSEQQILQQGSRESVKRSVFTFHKKDRQEIREQWIKVLKLKHKNLNPENFEVYELYFHDTDFFDHSATWRNKARQNSTKSTMKTFTDLLNRGNYIYPSRMAIDISKNICRNYRCLTGDKRTRYVLLGCTNPKVAFKRVMVRIIAINYHNRELNCVIGHEFLRKVLRTMAGTLFNVLISIFTKELSSDIHTDKSRVKGIAVDTLSVSNDKIS